MEDKIVFYYEREKQYVVLLSICLASSVPGGLTNSICVFHAINYRELNSLSNNKTFAQAGYSLIVEQLQEILAWSVTVFIPLIQTVEQLKLISDFGILLYKIVNGVIIQRQLNNKHSN